MRDETGLLLGRRGRMPHYLFWPFAIPQYIRKPPNDGGKTARESYSYERIKPICGNYVSGYAKRHRYNQQTGTERKEH